MGDGGTFVAWEKMKLVECILYCNNIYIVDYFWLYMEGDDFHL